MTRELRIDKGNCRKHNNVGRNRLKWRYIVFQLQEMEQFYHQINLNDALTEAYVLVVNK